MMRSRTASGGPASSGAWIDQSRRFDEPDRSSGLSSGPVFIGGSGRSGSTWVLDALAAANHGRAVFEPLHPANGKTAAYWAGRRLRPVDDAPDLEEMLARFLNGRARSLWSDFRVRPDRLRLYPGMLWRAEEFKRWARRLRKLTRHYVVYRDQRKRLPVLVKAIRANLMLGWVRAHLGARVVLIVRHPGAVAESRLRLGGEDWNAVRLLDRYRRDPLLQAEYLGSRAKVFEADLSPLEQQVVLWCVENDLPVRRGAMEDYNVVFFEDLVSDKDGIWRSLAEGLGLSNIPDTENRLQPSQQAWGKGRLGAPGEPHWMQALGSEGLDRVQNTLDAMGSDLYRAEYLEPQWRPSGHRGNGG